MYSQTPKERVIYPEAGGQFNQMIQVESARISQ